MLNEPNQRGYGEKVINELVTALENYKGQLIVILAGYEREMNDFLNVNPGLRSRIRHKIIFDDYSSSEIIEVVKLFIRDNNPKWKLDEEILEREIISLYESLASKEGGNGRWARNYVEELITMHANNSMEKNSDDIYNITNETVIMTSQLLRKNES